MKPNRKPFELTAARAEWLAKACEIAAAQWPLGSVNHATYLMLAEKLVDGDTLTPNAN
jgi:hypothetical protein